MANVFKRKGIWHARFMHSGKDYFRSTGVPVGSGSKKAVAASRTAAEAELSRMLAEIRGGASVDALFLRLIEALELLPKREREPKRIILAERLRQGVVTALAVSDAWRHWLDNPRKRNPSPKTIEMYLAYWGRDEARKHGRRREATGFKHWLKRTHPEIVYLHEVTKPIAEEYAAHLWRSGVAPRTYNGAIAFLQSMFKVLKTAAGLAVDVWEDISAQENNTQGRRNLTTEELQAICSSATGPLRYWLAIGIYTGLRLGDVVTLRWSEIDFNEHVIKRVPNKTRRKGKVVTFPLHPVLEALLQEWRQLAPASSEFLFPEDAAVHAAKGASPISARIQQHFEGCGITTTEQVAGQHRKRAVVRVGFHSLRHSFVSLCAANHVPQVAIMDLVGHGSPTMTALYSHAGTEQKADAIAKLPSLGFKPARRRRRRTLKLATT